MIEQWDSWDCMVLKCLKYLHCLASSVFSDHPPVIDSCNCNPDYPGWLILGVQNYELQQALTHLQGVVARGGGHAHLPPRLPAAKGVGVDHDDLTI